MDGFIDNQGNFGADGIVGPHHEKEGSFYTIKQLWSPVQIMNTSVDKQFDGKFSVENRYDFLNLNTCRFLWKQVKFPTATDASNTTAQVLKQGKYKEVMLQPIWQVCWILKQRSFRMPMPFSSQPSTDTVMNFGAGLSL